MTFKGVKLQRSPPAWSVFVQFNPLTNSENTSIAVQYYKNLVLYTVWIIKEILTKDILIKHMHQDTDLGLNKSTWWFLE